MPTVLVGRARIMELAFSIPVRQIIILATVLLVLLERIVAVSINFTCGLFCMIDALLYCTIFVYETVKCQFTEVQLLRKCILSF